MLTRLLRARPNITRQVRLFSATPSVEKVEVPKIDAFDRFTTEW